MAIHGVALTIPEPWGSILRAARTASGDPLASIIPPHITLLPPTEISAGGLGAFREHLASVAAAAAPFEVVLSSTGTFRPVSRVVFVQVSRGIADCERLEQAVRSGPVRRDLVFPYHPHVTIAHDVDEAALDRAFEGSSDFRCSFEAAAIDLYQCDDEGFWHRIDVFPLASDAADRG